MKTKKYLIAIAIIGGMLFTAYTTNTISNEQQSAKVDKRARPILAEAKVDKTARPILAEARVDKTARPILA